MRLIHRLLTVCVLGLCLGSAFPAEAQDGRGRQYKGTAAQFRDEGRDPFGFSTICSSVTWTVLSSSDTISRSMTMFIDPANTVAVCLSTMTGTAYGCTTATPGMYFPATTYAVFTDYTSFSWKCKAGAGATAVVGGVRARDRGDFGAISW